MNSDDGPRKRRRSDVKRDAMSEAKRETMARRESAGVGLSVLSVEHDKRGRPSVAMVNVGGSFYEPTRNIANVINAALDPVRAPGKATTLAEMSDEKRAEMEKLYGGRVRGPVVPKRLRQLTVTAPWGGKRSGKR